MSEKAIPFRRGSNDAQIQRIREYQKKNANIIFLCEPFNLPELHRLIVEEVKISGDPKDLDVFQPSGSKNFTLHLAALERLAVAAGADWVNERTGAVTVSRELIHYRATAQITREYGKKVAWTGEAIMDFEIVKDDLMDEYRAKADKGQYDPKTKRMGKWSSDKARQEYIDYCVNRDFRAKRKHGLKLCASDAKAVALRKLFNVGQAMPQAVFQRPFVIVRCVVAPDYNDPETARLLTNHAVLAAAGIYGERPLSLPSPGVETPDAFNVVDVPDDDFTGPGAETVIDGQVITDTDGAPDEPENPALIDFENSDADDQMATLKALMLRKQYDPKDLKTPLERFNDKNRVRFFQHLLDLPDPEPQIIAAGVDDDIPF